MRASRYKPRQIATWTLPNTLGFNLERIIHASLPGGTKDSLKMMRKELACASRPQAPMVKILSTRFDRQQLDREQRDVVMFPL